MGKIIKVYKGYVAAYWIFKEDMDEDLINYLETMFHRGELVCRHRIRAFERDDMYFVLKQASEIFDVEFSIEKHLREEYRRRRDALVYSM